MENFFWCDVIGWLVCDLSCVSDMLKPPKLQCNDFFYTTKMWRPMCWSKRFPGSSLACSRNRWNTKLVKKQRILPKHLGFGSLKVPTSYNKLKTNKEKQKSHRNKSDRLIDWLIDWLIDRSTNSVVVLDQIPGKNQKLSSKMRNVSLFQG